MSSFDKYVIIKKLEEEMGKIVISQKAIAKIAGLATVESYGVVGLVPYNVKTKLLSLLEKNSLDRGVEVKIDGERVIIDLFVVIQGGTNILEVAKTIISQVTYVVKKITSINQIDVNVIVKGIKREE